MQWLDFFQVEDGHQNANRTYHGHVYKGWQSKYWNHSLSFRPNDAKGRAIRAPNWDSFSNPDQKMCNRRDHTRPPTVFRTSTLHQFWSKNNTYFSHKNWQNHKYHAKSSRSASFWNQKILLKYSLILRTFLKTTIIKHLALYFCTLMGRTH